VPFSVRLVTPYGVVAERDDAGSVFASGEAGDLGILPGHTPLLAALRIGEVRVRSGKGAERFAIGGGLLEASPTNVTIMAQSAEPVGKIDMDRARQARKRAEERLASRAEGVDIARAQAALARALNRMRVAQRRK
jgi:F-type H+-transporting ATPase subunit epsilon